MKNKVCMALSIAAFLTISSNAAFAADSDVSIRCPEANMLSSIFVTNWMQTSSNYFSYVTFPIPKHILQGALHTLTAEKPADLNPHLKFHKLVIHLYNPERGTKQIDCQYTIGNATMEDLSDGLLHMTAEFVPN